MDHDDKRFEAMLLDYEMARDDERNYTTVQATLFSLALASISLIALFLVKDEGLCSPTTDSGCWETPDSILAAMPMIPLALISYLQVNATTSTLRSYYLRALEREVREYFRTDDRLMRTKPRPAAFGAYELAVTSLSVSGGSGPLRWLTAMMIGAVPVVLGGITVGIGLLVSRPWQIGMALFYGTFVIIEIWAAWRASVRGRSLYAEAVVSQHKRLVLSLEEVRGAGRSQRSLLSYLILPRPEDLVKACFFPLGTLIAASTALDQVDLEKLDAAGITTWVLVWLCLELLIYQARYQWNDIRGLADDTNHPEDRARGRLPHGHGVSDGAAVASSLAVMATRLVLVALVASAAPMPADAPLLTLTCVVFGVGAIYEFLREARPSGRAPRATLSWGIFACVGVGYAVRGLAGVWCTNYLVADVRDNVQWGGVGSFGSDYSTWLSLGAFLWLYGCVFVVLTWVLDASSYCYEIVHPGMTHDPQCSRSLSSKPHLVYLLNSLKISARPVDANHPAPQGRFSQTLRTGDRWVTPHGVLTALAAASAGWLGVKLSLSGGDGPVLAVTTATALGGVLLSLIGAGDKSTRYLPTICLLGTASIVLIIGPEPAAPLGMAMLTGPWLLLGFTVQVFRRTSYAQLKYGWRASLLVAITAIQAVGARLVGRKAAKALGLAWRGGHPHARLRAAERLLMPGKP